MVVVTVTTRCGCDNGKVGAVSGGGGRVPADV